VSNVSRVGLWLKSVITILSCGSHLSPLSLTWTAAAPRVPASEKYDAYHDQESQETSACQQLDRITRIYDEGQHGPILQTGSGMCMT